MRALHLGELPREQQQRRLVEGYPLDQRVCHAPKQPQLPLQPSPAESEAEPEPREEEEPPEPEEEEPTRAPRQQHQHQRPAQECQEQQRDGGTRERQPEQSDATAERKPGQARSERRQRATQRVEDDAELVEVHRQVDGARQEVVEVVDRVLDLEEQRVEDRRLVARDVCHVVGGEDAGQTER